MMRRPPTPHRDRDVPSRARHLRGLAALALVAGLAVPGAPAPAGAQISGGCTATIAGQDLAAASSPSRAIEVGHEEVVEVRGIDPAGAAYTRISLRFPPLPAFEVYQEDHVPPGPDWGGEVAIADYARWGVGLYQIEGSTDHCTGTAWIKVTGRSPFTTVAGVAGTLVGLAGLAAVALSLVRVRPSWASLLRSGGAAVPLGLGAAVLAQQAGITPLTGLALAGWTGAAVTASGLANVGIGALRGAGVPPA
jgi:hypothetical protein